MNALIEVDRELLEHAARVTGGKDHRKVVEQALNELIRRRAKIEALLAMAGTVQFHEGYDYKALRAGGDDNS
jgi:Arc/MetJ family transcription regulator